jgi:hypothetical protein
MSIAPSTTDEDFSLGSYQEQQMRIPGLDGYRAEKVAVSFSGGVELDKTNTEHLDFLDDLKLGASVQITVVASVTKKGFTLALAEDGPGSAGYGVGLKVHSLEVA